MYLLEVMLPSNFQMFNFKAWELKSEVTAKFKAVPNRQDHISTANNSKKIAC